MLDFVTALGRNVALAFALTFAYSLVSSQLKSKESLFYRSVVGTVFGIIGIFTMLTPIPLAPGIFTDGRDVIIVLAGLVAGTESAVVAGVLVIIARWLIGGIGTVPGMGIAATAIILAWLAKRYLNGPISKASPRFFIIVGLAITFISRFWVMTLPDKELAFTLIRTTSIQLAITSAIETLLLGSLLAREVRREETEAALIESENRFAKVFRASPVAIAISTLYEGTFVDANDSFLKLIGFSRDKVIGHRAIELNTWARPEERDQLVSTLNVNQSVHDREVEIQSQDGQLHHVLISAERIELGGKPHILSLTYDITERKTFEAALRKMNVELEQRVQERTAELQSQQQLLQTTLDSMGEGVMYCSDSTIRYVNPALEELCGYVATELVAQPKRILDSGTHSSQHETRFSDEEGAADRTWRGETHLRCKDGRDIRVALTVRRQMEMSPGIGGTVTLVRDITVEKELEEQKARFIANASHELRTPITNMTTRLYLLKRQPEKFNEHVAVMERVTRQMYSLVEDLLEVARFERGVVPLNLAVVKLQDLVTDVVSVQREEAEKKSITLATELAQNPLHTKGDATRLGQVITNLVVNAIQYTPEGGCITVLLDQLPEQNVESARLSIKDTGVGIDSEHLKRVFEPFFRVNESAWRGTGLGLSISKEIVEQHGGSLSVESEVGNGSTFIIRLPLSPVA